MSQYWITSSQSSFLSSTNSTLQKVLFYVHGSKSISTNTPLPINFFCCTLHSLDYRSNNYKFTVSICTRLCNPPILQLSLLNIFYNLDSQLPLHNLNSPPLDSTSTITNRLYHYNSTHLDSTRLHLLDHHN